MRDGLPFLGIDFILRTAVVSDSALVGVPVVFRACAVTCARAPKMCDLTDFFFFFFNSISPFSERKCVGMCASFCCLTG